MSKVLKWKWTDIWKPPFRYDHYGYIWSEDNVMVFTVDDLTEENDRWMQVFCDNMVKALNGDECEQYPGLNIKDGCDLYQQTKDNLLIGSFRGWGHLTGGLRMRSEDAAAVQDEMIQFVLDKIGKK